MKIINWDNADYAKWSNNANNANNVWVPGRVFVTGPGPRHNLHNYAELCRL